MERYFPPFRAKREFAKNVQLCIQMPSHRGQPRGGHQLHIQKEISASHFQKDCLRNQSSSNSAAVNRVFIIFYLF
jgi:hypothetical protein